MNADQPALKPPTAPTPPAAVPAGTTRSLRFAAVVLLLLVIVGVFFGLIPRWRHETVLRAETLQLAIPTISVVSAEPSQGAAALTLPAEIRPFVEAPIYARASGYLKSYLVDMGAHVVAGQLLAEIDTPELNQELAQSRAQLAQAQAALELAKTTAARWADLLKTSSVSEQEAAEKQADLELKSANVEAARANVHRLEELKSFDSVRAPFAGTITARGTDVGQLIPATGGRELFRLAQTDPLRVYVRLPQAVARGVSAGQVAELSIPEIPGRTFPAKVVRTAGAMSSDSRTLLAELEVDNSRDEILAGAYAQIRFADAKSDPTLMLPSNTLLFRPEGPQVGVLGTDGKVQLRTVSLGRDFGPTVEIVGGIDSTDRVVLNPPDSLFTGMTLRVAEPTPPPITK